MAQIRHILPRQPWMAQADEFHVAVDVFEDEINFFAIDVAVDTSEGDGKGRLGVGMGVINIALVFRVAEGIPESLGF